MGKACPRRHCRFLNSFILQPANTSNIDEDTPGLWTMAILNDLISDTSPPNTPFYTGIVCHMDQGILYRSLHRSLHQPSTFTLEDK